MVQTTEIDIYTSPSCPWAWRSALWIRQVAAQTPLKITWKLFSLHIVNLGHDYSPDGLSFGYQAVICGSPVVICGRTDRSRPTSQPCISSRSPESRQHRHG